MRTALAADTLAEAVDTSDFRRIYAFGESCEADGVRLTIFSPGGGVMFDSRGGGASPRSLDAVAPCGAFSVRISIPEERVLAPFDRARSLFVLAALAGAAGVALVFLLVYRQRVRIAELKRLEKFRRDFIADFSHEMKTPLAGLIGAAELLGECAGKDPAAESRLAGMIRRESARLNSLAQDILSLARLERGAEASVRMEPADVSEIAADAVRSFEVAAEKKGVALKFEPAAGGATVPADAQLVSQAVSNLIDNALVHSGCREIRVSVVSAAHEVRIAVEDDGEGVAPEHRGRIFERFYRADPSRTAAGSGLGLAIVREIARLHGGDASYSPLQPRGSRFELVVSG